MKVNKQIYRIAIDEANELLTHAIEIDDFIQKSPSEKSSRMIGKLITANVLLGLSIEIYLKAFMIAGRNDGLVKGHNLKKLYDTFPPFLKKAIEKEYNSFDKTKVESLQIALMFSKEKPSTPKGEKANDFDINDFNSTLTSISNIFTNSRYFFEGINEKEWTIFDYFFGPGKLIALSLKQVLDDYLEGKFANSNKMKL